MQVEIGHPPPGQRVPLFEVAVDVGTRERPGDAPARLVHLQQFGHDVAEGLVTVVGAAGGPAAQDRQAEATDANGPMFFLRAL
jgi:hypothetical protein